MGRVWLTLAVASIASVVPMAAAAGPDSATYRYDLGLRATGDVAGSCEAAFLDATADGVLRVEGARAWLHVYETFVNSTVVGDDSGRPVEVARNVTQRSRSWDLPMPLAAAWSPGGRAALVERGMVLEGGRPFGVSFQGRGLEARPALPDVPGVSFWDARDGEPIWSLAGAAFARELAILGGAFVATGDLALFFQDGEAAGVPTGAAFERSETQQPGVLQRSDTYRHGVLDVSGARIAVGSSRVVCRGLEARVDGIVTAYGAHGELRQGGMVRSFAGQELELDGDFELRERVDDADEERPAVHASVSGTFRRAGLDFLPVAGSGLPPAGTIAVAGAAAAAGALALWKLAALLFTRLRADALLDREGRRRVYEAIQANPGTSLADVARVAETSESNARYHLRVLRSHRRIRSYKVQGTWRYALIETDVTETRRRSLLEADAVVRRLLELLAAGPLPAGDLIAALGREGGLSRSGGWKAVDRAFAAQLILKERQGKKVILRSA